MRTLNNHEQFQADYLKLKEVSLNPARHAAANAYEHSEQVRIRARHLAELNSCTEEEIGLLEDLAQVHDIGKITGTAKPQASVDILNEYGIDCGPLMYLVKYHDTNLPWFKSDQRGQPPSDKAWKKMCRSVDVRLLCLFMVADRVDCPGGWKGNPPLVWFLNQVHVRELLEHELILDDGPQVESNQTWK